MVGTTDHLRADDGLLALGLYELRSWQGRSLPFHDVMAGRALEPAPEVLVQFPRWRGHRFLDVLEWLVCDRLASPGAAVTWLAERRGGAMGVRRLLEQRSWSYTERSDGRLRRFEGDAPPPGPRPQPRTFSTRLGTDLEFAADWGVFSEGHVDPGTRQLFEAALVHSPIETVVDVGTGYGPLAIGLVASGAARRAVGTDVDAVSLALAIRNGRTTDVPCSFVLEDDPAKVEGASLTVCALPTHAPRDRAEALIASLVSRCRSEPVLVGVHHSLEARYIRRFAVAGAHATVVSRGEHAIMRLSRP